MYTQKIHSLLKYYWGYENFRSLQEDIILSVLEGKDTLALMPTGGGKSITYQVAALALEGVCVVVTPLIALMKDQVEDLSERGICAEAIYTGMTAEHVNSVLNKAICDKIKFLYISPERLMSETFRVRLKQIRVCLFAVDEAHCISQWGYDFRPSYLKIADVRGFFPGVPILALTATATPPVVKDIQQQLLFSAPHVLSSSFRRENLAYIARKTEDKPGETFHILSRMNSAAIVYVRKRSTAEQLAFFLNEKGIVADFYHAGLTTLQREKRQNDWKSGVTPVIVATNAFGMGINKADVRVVVHFDIPDSMEAYFQEAGRAGRDGEKAFAVLLWNDSMLRSLKARISKAFPDKTHIKQIYVALGDFFQIAEGAGKDYAFEFNPEQFAKFFKLERSRIFSTLKILETGGYLECTVDVNARSRLSFVIARDKLYGYSPNHQNTERLLEVLMRKYPGIFTQYVFISEKYIAEELGIGAVEIYESLIRLSRDKIISYIPGNDRLYVIYHQPRLPLSYLSISKSIYEERKEAYAAKVNQMVSYIEAPEKCRQLILMEYFGQKEKKECGICDICLSRKKYAAKISREQIDEAVVTLLSEGNREIKDLVATLDHLGKEQVIKRVRQLLDEGTLVFVKPTILSLGKQ